MRFPFVLLSSALYNVNTESNYTYEYKCENYLKAMNLFALCYVNELNLSNHIKQCDIEVGVHGAAAYTLYPGRC